MNNTLASFETGEPGRSSRGMWWTYKATQNGTLKVEVANPTDGTTAYTWRYTAAFKSTSTDVTALGAAVAQDGYMNDYWPVLNFAVVAGETYKIRAASYADSQYGRYRLKVTLN